jgi:hypothetical protein
MTPELYWLTLTLLMTLWHTGYLSALLVASEITPAKRARDFRPFLAQNSHGIVFSSRSGFAPQGRRSLTSALTAPPPSRRQITGLVPLAQRRIKLDATAPAYLQVARQYPSASPQELDLGPNSENSEGNSRCRQSW